MLNYVVKGIKKNNMQLVEKKYSEVDANCITSPGCWLFY